jgi:hypothetical protein
MGKTEKGGGGGEHDEAPSIVKARMSLAGGDNQIRLTRLIGISQGRKNIPRGAGEECVVEGGG